MRLWYWKLRRIRSELLACIGGMTVVSIIIISFVMRNKGYAHYSAGVLCKSDIAKLLWPDKIERLVEIQKRSSNSMQLENEYFEFVENQVISCFHQMRLGPYGDEGGWDVCVDGKYDIHKPCIVYSFGIDHDFRFENAAEKELGCKVYAFDPSMGVSSYNYSKQGQFFDIGIGLYDETLFNGWKMMNLKSIMEMLQHKTATIDLIKMDIEYSEWPALYHMLIAKLLKQVRQLVIEVHSPEVDLHTFPNDRCSHTSHESLSTQLSILLLLQEAGFQLFFTRTNYRTIFKSSFSELMRPCCVNLHFINLKFNTSI